MVWPTFANAVWWTGVIYGALAVDALANNNPVKGCVLGAVCLWDFLVAVSLDDEQAPWGNTHD